MEMEIGRRTAAIAISKLCVFVVAVCGLPTLPSAALEELPPLRGVAAVRAMAPPFTLSLNDPAQEQDLDHEGSEPGQGPEEAIDCPEQLVTFIEKGDAKALEEILSGDASLKNCMCEFHLEFLYGDTSVKGTALHFAAYTGSVQIVKALLANDFRADATTSSDAEVPPLRQATPLSFAAIGNRAEVVKQLLLLKQVDVNAPAEGGWTALVGAAAMGSFEVVELLLQTEGIAVTPEIEDGDSPLFRAAISDHPKIVSALLRAPGVEVNKMFHEVDMTPLIVVSTPGRCSAAVVKVLLQDSRVGVNLENKAEYSALMMAAGVKKGSKDPPEPVKCPSVVEALLQSNQIHIDQETMNQYGQHLLWLASKGGGNEAVRQLLQDNRVLVNKMNEDGLTPLMLAARYGQSEVIELLLEEKKVKVNEVDQTLRTALLWAVEEGQDKAVKALLGSSKVSIDWTGQDGKSALSLAAEKDKGKVIDALLKSDQLSIDAADQEAWSNLVESMRKHRTEEGPTTILWTPLRGALRGHLALTTMLLQLGASWESDIDDSDLEARKLGVRLGTKFSLMKLLDRAAGQLAWSRVSDHAPAFSCLEDLEESDCECELLTLAKSRAMVHWLLDWQGRQKGLKAERDAEAKRALLDSLRRGKWLVAQAYLSRGIGNKMLFEGSTKEAVRSLTEQQRSMIQHWNMLHWCAYSCDSHLTSAFKLATSMEFLTFLDYRPETGEAEVDRTPMEIATEKKEECPDHFATFETLQALKQAKGWSAWNLIEGFFFSIACCWGSLASNIFFLRLQTLRRKGLLFMSVAPLLFALGGVLIVTLEWSFTTGIPAVQLAQSGLSCLAVLLGAALSVAVWLAFASTKFTRWLQRIKKRGTDALDRFWERLDCAMSWLLVFVLMIGAVMTLGTGLWALLLGLLHAVASTLPLCIAKPKRFVFPLRLVSGLIFLAFLVHSAIQKLGGATGDSSFNMLSPATLVLIATSLSLAWVDSPGQGDCHHFVGTPQEGETELALREGADTKFTANKLVLGRGAIAAQGIQETLGLSEVQLYQGMKDTLGAMRQEVLAAGDENDLENFDYIVRGTSGCKADYPSAVALSLETGVYHGGTIGPYDFDTGHEGRTLQDWMQVEEVQLAKLTEAEFVAVRFYTSSSFPKINGPLRKLVRPHPWAMVVYLMDRGIKKLRAVQAQVNPEAFAGRTVLWRGMKNLEVDIKEFAAVGGTEMAPMSTTTNEEVALHYATSKVPLVFKYVVGGLKTGVSIRFLSLYPKEEEFLYAPLTFLSLKSHYEDDGTTILVVEPVMS